MNHTAATVRAQDLANEVLAMKNDGTDDEERARHLAAGLQEVSAHLEMEPGTLWPLAVALCDAFRGSGVSPDDVARELGLTG